MPYLMINTNGIVSFEQLGPVLYTWGKKKRKFKFLNTESLFVNKLI